jgi:ribosomal-protein-alanine N-acetyltransferase
MNARFWFRKFEQSDLHYFIDQVTDEDCMRYVALRPLSTNEIHEKFESILEINAKDPNLGYFLVFESLTQRVIGQAKLVWNVSESQPLELGYMLFPSFWGQGLGYELALEMLQLAQKKFPHSSVMAVIHPDNAGSARILEKLGMKPYFLGEEDGLPTQKWKM